VAKGPDAMRRRPQLRRVLKWGGTVASLLILLALAFTAKGTAGLIWAPPPSGPPYRNVYVFLNYGAFRVDSFTRATPFTGPRWRAYHPAPYTWFLRCTSQRLGHLAGELMPRNSPTWIWWFRSYGSRGNRGMELPLWIPFLLVLIPTAFLWYRDHRHPPGHCGMCGYDLTSNETGRCPECGTQVPDEQQGSQRV
jgi:hypothetical protein